MPRTARCPRPSGSGTEISAHVEIPDREGRGLDAQRDIIRRSVRGLARIGAARADDGA